MKIFIILSFFLSLPSLATVVPSEAHLSEQSTLIIDGKIIGIRKKSPLKLKVSLKVENTVKGKISGNEVQFEYSDTPSKGHLFKNCLNKSICADYPQTKYRFYLKKSVESDNYVLVDEWFGLKSL